MAELTAAVSEVEERVSAVEETTSRIDHNTLEISHKLDLMLQDVGHDRQRLCDMWEEVYGEGKLKDTTIQNKNSIRELQDFQDDVKSIGRWIIVTGGGVIIVAILNLILK